MSENGGRGKRGLNDIEAFGRHGALRIGFFHTDRLAHGLSPGKKGGRVQPFPAVTTMLKTMRGFTPSTGFCVKIIKFHNFWELPFVESRPLRRVRHSLTSLSVIIFFIQMRPNDSPRGFGPFKWAGKTPGTASDLMQVNDGIGPGSVKQAGLMEVRDTGELNWIYMRWYIWYV